MKKEQGLKTLGDYRRVAKDSLFSLELSPESNSASVYDAINTALVLSRWLIADSRAYKTELIIWGGICFPKTKYELKNLGLFYCIKLMEFAITYNSEESINDLLQNWPKRPDVKASVFASAGISYLEAAFSFVQELGGDIISLLQNAYKRYTKEGNVIYRDPFKFLDKTPTVDNLLINPVPDIIIKTWYDSILVETRKCFPKNQFSRQTLEAEFNQIHKQLEHERDVWKNSYTGDKNQRSDDLITLTVAIKKFKVSKTTLRRAIKDGRLVSYKDITKSSNSLSMVSESEVEKYWPII